MKTTKPLYFQPEWSLTFDVIKFFSHKTDEQGETNKLFLKPVKKD